MVAQLLKVFRSDGSRRAVWSDANGPAFRAAGVLPRRASRVEAVPDGPRAGDFHVDFTPLALLTGDPRHALCLARTFASYAEAVRAEVEWLTANWVFG